MEAKKDKAGILQMIKGYVRETLAEAKKVVWPDKKYVISATIIILIIVFLSSAFVLVVDISFAQIFDFLNVIFKPGY